MGLRVRRVVGVVVASLGFGLVATVGIAWGSAVWLSLYEEGYGDPFVWPADPPRWVVSTDRRALGVQVRSSYFGFQTPGAIKAEAPPAWSRAARAPETADVHLGPDLKPMTLIEEARGWPLPALCWSMEASPGSVPWVLVDDAVRGGFVIGHWADPNSMIHGPRVMPWRPNGWRFGACVAAWAALAAVVLVAPRAARFLLRARRGQCRACGFSLTGLTGDRCPECGRTTGRSQETASAQ